MAAVRRTKASEAPPSDPPGAPPTGPPQSGPTWERLEDQIGWYDRNSSKAGLWYKLMKVLQLVAAAAIPVAAILNAPKAVPGVLGSLIVVLEGVQQLFRNHENWVTYRSTCEALKRERFLYLARAGPYAGLTLPQVLLAERVEALASQEHDKWVSNQTEQPHKPGSTGEEPARAEGGLRSG